MQNFRFENMCLITNYENCEHATTFVVDYGSQLLLPSLMEACKSLMLNVIDEPQLVEGSKVNFKDMFHTIWINPITLKHLLSREFNGYCHYLVDIDYKDALSWWHIEQQKIPIVENLVKHILSILASQIKIEKIFLIVGLLTSFHKCHFQTNNLNKLLFFNNNLPPNSRIDYLKHVNLANTCDEWFNLIDELEAKFEDGVKCWEFLKVEDMNYLSQCYINGKACYWIFIRGLFCCFKLNVDDSILWKHDGDE